MFTVILADAQLELIPAKLHGAPSVKRRARERRRPPGDLLLDQALDHKHMKNLPNAERRGRPDIVHFALLLLQDSLLAQKKQLRVLIHTRDDALVRVRSDLRPPRSQVTSYQLFEDLLRQGRVPSQAPLLTLETGWPLARVVAQEAKGPVIVLDETGAPARTAMFETLARASPDLTLVLGAFPRGPWREPPRADHLLRVAEGGVSAWTALVPVLAGFEDSLAAPKS
jgi:rRNA small subunit pseudouridine methyltransferase Nep1